mmetsp:Transcript_28901/g.74165  ORF Transcript_28901/g.74165 Transcript_28901/m.74165 type:complete len:94 (+) Transcript_28901:1184-1465(+)
MHLRQLQIKSDFQHNISCYAARTPYQTPIQHLLSLTSRPLEAIAPLLSSHNVERRMPKATQLEVISGYDLFGAGKQQHFSLSFSIYYTRSPNK